MSKTLCELDKKKRKKYTSKSGKYICQSCEHSVEKKKRVCRPVKL